MQKYILKDWFIVSGSKPYTAPEMAGRKLSGKVYGNPAFADGSEITTSRIATVNGREIVCISGNIYVLEGEPSLGYVEWCAQNGHILDPEDPIKVR